MCCSNLRLTPSAKCNSVWTADSLCLLSVSYTVTLFDPILPLVNSVMTQFSFLSHMYYPAMMQIVFQLFQSIGINQAINFMARLKNLVKMAAPLIPIFETELFIPTLSLTLTYHYSLFLFSNTRKQSHNYGFGALHFYPDRS